VKSSQTPARSTEQAEKTETVLFQKISLLCIDIFNTKWYHESARNKDEIAETGWLPYRPPGPTRPRTLLGKSATSRESGELAKAGEPNSPDKIDSNVGQSPTNQISRKEMVPMTNTMFIVETKAGRFAHDLRELMQYLRNAWQWPRTKKRPSGAFTSRRSRRNVLPIKVGHFT